MPVDLYTYLQYPRSTPVPSHATVRNSWLKGRTADVRILPPTIPLFALTSLFYSDNYIPRNTSIPIVTAITMALPPRLVIVIGTYDGVLGGWEKQYDGSLKLTLATSVHQGSLRSLSMAAAGPNKNEYPGTLLSCGYDEMLKTHDWSKRLNSSGEVRTPSDFGTPVCSSFAPPPNTASAAPSTHCVVGFAGGKITLYKKRDWSLQHVLAGHDGGVSALGVHPSGKLALSGGQSDGKLKLWDLTKGRLAYASKLTPTATRGGRSVFDPVVSIVWTQDGDAYAWAYGNHITVRDVATGKDLLDVELPGKVNQITILEGEDGIFVAAACNDGSLPVLSVGAVDEDESTRRAIMAIEAVEGVVAGEERFKCIQAVNYGYKVITANSAGVVSVMDLQGAINMMMNDDGDQSENDVDDQGERPSDRDSSDSDDDEDDEMELAVDIIASVQLGSGARVTCLAAWASHLELEEDIDEEEHDATDSEDVHEKVEDEKSQRKRKEPVTTEVELDSSAVEKARALVSKAKKLEKKRAKKKRAKVESN